MPFYGGEKATENFFRIGCKENPKQKEGIAKSSFTGIAPSSCL
jgi:hypothetical protein